MTRGFVQVADGELVDGAGHPLQLRGVGLGNWLLPEGYMWRLPGQYDSPRRIEAMITDLVGDDRARAFWAAFRDRFIAEADVARIAAEGFNHVRLAINSRVLLDEGFAVVDRLIEWCRAHQLWVLLDLHGAPGGQTGTNIDDSPNRRPELFEQAHYRQQTVELWTTIAHRYRDEPVVCGYDLLNEPLPDEYQHTYADRLASLYQELTAAIRAVDPNHLITYEGSQWATNWSIFTEVWDPNTLLQFHKYWSPPDLPSIRQYIDIGERLELPIYMGEGGENNLDWIQTVFQLFDDHKISWNFWPWKKMDTLTSPCSIDLPDGWDAIVGWAAETQPKPDPDDAWATLSELLRLMDLERCTYRTDVVNAMLRRAPLRFPATGFTFNGPSVSYSTAGGTPLKTFRSNEQVTIRAADGTRSEPEFSYTRGDAGPGLVVELAAGDWVSYEANVTKPAELVIAADADGDFSLSLDGVEVTAGRTADVVQPGKRSLRVTALGRTTLRSVTLSI